MTREEADFIGGMNMCDEISNEAYKKIMCHCEEQEPCEDAVSRKELLKIYEDRFWELQKLKHLKENKGAEDRQLGVNYCINILREMPSVTPQPDTARRIVGKSRGGMTLWYQCERCNEPVDVQDTFCSGCGRRLVNGCEKQAEEGQ